MRTARGTKLFALTGVLALVTAGLAACGGETEPEGPPTCLPASASEDTTVKVGLAYDIGGRGDKSFNDAAAVGLDKAVTELGIAIKELPATQGESEADKETRLLSLAKEGYNPVIAVGFAYATALAAVAPQCTDVSFGIVDDSSVTLDNVTSLVFAEEEGSFLVGAVAALKSTTGHVGFIGGCTVPLIQKFEAGYVAGAKQINPDVVVEVDYLSTPADACSGFNDPAKGKTTAEGQYDKGADIVYQAAGGSGTGVFQAASEKGALAIGVDSDQYFTVDPSLQSVIISSMLKRVDVAVYTFIDDFATTDGAPKTGVVTFDLSVNGVGFSTSGGKIDDIAAQVEALKAQIISGAIEVPDTPAA